MAHFIYPQATSTTAFSLDGSTVSPTYDSGNALVNKGMPVVTLAGEGLGPLDVNTGAAGALTLRVVLSSDSTISIEEDKNYGVVGANTIRTAAQIGNATGAAEFGTGADSAQTLRVTLSTRAETAATPLSVRLSDGSAFLSNLPVSQSGTWNINNISGTISLPSGAATESTLSAISGQLPATLGSKVAAQSISVVQAPDQNVPISATALPLPNGAATDTSVQSIVSKLPVSLGQKVMADSLAVTIASNQSALAVSAASLPLPSGAATETTLSALNGKVTQDFGVSTTGVRVAALVGSPNGIADFNGGTTTLNTLRVTLANDVNPRNGYVAFQVINRDYSLNSISGTFATLGSTLSNKANCVTFFETGGSPIVIGWGGFEQFHIPPGGAESPLLVEIPAGTQLQIKTADGSTVNSGRFLMSVFS